MCGIGLGLSVKLRDIVLREEVFVNSRRNVI
jgi:hypothetical protein